MDKAFFISDSWALTGPSIVNSYYRKYLGAKYCFAPRSSNLYARIAFSIGHIISSKVVVFSGVSRLDACFLNICKLLKKKTIYIMHGCVVEENRINRVDAPKEDELEQLYLREVDLVLCVSPVFTDWVKNKFPQYAKKVYTLTNGIDWNALRNEDTQQGSFRHDLSIVGGGVPRKNVLSVCKAVKMLNNSRQDPLKLIIFGRDDLDTPAIKEYGFVEYNGKIPRNEMLKKISRTPLFIQNSRFDSFALAPLEALTVGCSILCSVNVGALSIIDGLSECDVIKDCEDEYEIADKISYLLEHPNHDRLLSGIDKEATSYKARSMELEKYIDQLIMGGL